MSTPEGSKAASTLLARLAEQKGGATALAQQTANVNTVTPETVHKAPTRTVAQVARETVIAVPKLLSASHVLFKSPRMHFGTADTQGVAIRFVNGYYQTADTAQIKFLRDNAAAFRLEEVKVEEKK